MGNRIKLDENLMRLVEVNNQIQLLLQKQEENPIDFFIPNKPQEKFGASPKRNRWLFSGNRCLPEGSLIDTPQGQVATENIKIGDIVFAYDKQLKQAVETRVVGVYDNGLKECCEVNVSGGFSFKCSYDHKYLSKDPNKDKYLFRTPETTKVNKHNRVVIPDKYNITPIETDLYPKFFRLIGYLLGDGSFTQDCIRFTNTNKIIVDDFKSCIPQGFCVRSRSGGEDYWLTIPNGVKHGNWIITFLREQGLWGLKSDKKFIPYIMKYAPEEHIKELLIGLFATDGWVKDNGYGFCSTSKQLVEDVMFLLKRIGILVNNIVEKKRKKETHKTLYSIYFSDYEYNKRFPDVIGKPKRLIKPENRHRNTIHSHRIKQINNIGIKRVYDLQIEHKDHIYITGGCAVHNSGKTEASAVEVVRFALGKHPHRKIEVPNVGWAVSPDANVSREVMEVKIRKYLNHADIKRWRERERIMELTNGSQIFFKSADSGVAKFTGRSIKYAAIDEDCPEEIYREILWRCFDQQGDIWGTITPLYSSWMYNSIYRNQYKDPEIEVIFGSIFDNADNLNIKEIERIRNSHSVDELDARLYGKFLKFAGLVYKEFDDNLHLIPSFKIPDEWVKLRFIDHGLHDPCACLWVAVSPENEYHCYREYYKTDRTIADNCLAIKNLSGNERYFCSYIDPATNKRSAQEKTTDYRTYVASGINPLRTWRKVEQQTKINAVITRLNNRKLFIHRGLNNLLDEIKSWGRDKTGEPERGGDHLLDCLGACCVENLQYSGLRQSLGGLITEIPTNSNTDNFF